MKTSLVCLLAVAAAIAFSLSHPGLAEDPLGKTEPKRLREGTVLSEVIGEFQITGERVTFFPQDGEPLRMLENLALERVTRVIEDSPGKRTWLVDGEVTEFRGGNYLLINRAILKRN